MENEIPIYNQILQQEQIELHKLMMIVENKNGTVLDVNTHSVFGIIPFKLEGLILRDIIGIMTSKFQNIN